MIGVLGGYGAVGRHAVEYLRQGGLGVLRVGGRDRGRAEALLGAAPEAEAMAVDIEDRDGLARFCAGCDCVVNCAGPSHELSARVAMAAAAAGAHVIDAHTEAGLEQVLHRIGDANPGWIAVTGAGMSPGLTGILPRFLAGTGFDRVRSLTGYIGGLDRLTHTAASDYLHSMVSGYGEAGAAWRGGARVSRHLVPLFDIELPFFPRSGVLNALPYLTTEAERVADLLSIEELSWYNVFDGRWGVSALSRLTGTLSDPGGFSDPGALPAACADLERANALDNFGRRAYQVLLFQMTGEQDRRQRHRTLVARAADSRVLTAATVAFSAAAVHHGAIPVGVHRAAEVVAPQALVDHLRTVPVTGGVEIVDDAEMNAMEDGSL